MEASAVKALLLNAAALCFVCATALARDAEGRLGVILSPSSTQPAIVVRGEEFTVLLRADATLRLESAAGSFALTASSSEDFRGHRRIRATFPSAIPAGMYTLIATSAETEDRNFRAVFVLDAPPESYRIAVWSNLRVGADPRSPDTALFRVSTQINAGRPDLILVAGDLSAGGSPEQFKLSLELLNDCAAPTLVVPGPADVAGGHAQDFLGDFPVAASFGFDAYLLCPAPGLDFGDGLGRLHSERRKIRSARWSIGAGWNLSSDELRAQLIVLVDDPLDAILGAVGTAPAHTSPWGPTRIFPAPTARGTLEWFTAGPRPIAPDAASPSR